MKKQFLIFATLTTIVFMSCRKEQIEEPQANQPEEFAASMNNADQQRGGGSLVNTINKGLFARFEFDGTLEDFTGKVAPGVPRYNKPIYTANRKGVKNSAIRFDATYGVDLFDIPLDTNMSVAFWMKADTIPSIVPIPVVEGSHCASFIHRENNRFQVNYWDFYNSSTIMARPLFNGWHHMAVTRTNKEFKLYIDGALAGTHTFVVGGPSGITYSEYVVGYGMNAGHRFWKGNIDDLRIYGRAITANEVSTLATY